MAKGDLPLGFESEAELAVWRAHCVASGARIVKLIEESFERPDALPSSQVEITPEMIEAGVEALGGFDAFFELSPTLEVLLVESVLAHAMAKKPRPKPMGGKKGC